MKNRMLIQVPFEGFYSSKYDSELDYCAEREWEWRADDSEYGESRFPEPVQLSESELSDKAWRYTEYSRAYDDIAQAYVPAFDESVSDILGLQLGLEFESMSSPRYYNFSTDRIFAHIRTGVVYLMFRKSRENGHMALRANIRESFRSRDGFIPHYSDNADSWLEKPLREWDHNEVMTLLESCLAIEETRDYDSIFWDCYESLQETVSNAFSDCVEWDSLESEWKEARGEKFAEWMESDAASAIAWACENAELFADGVANDEYTLAHVKALESEYLETGAIPYRCKLTPDMFA